MVAWLMRFRPARRLSRLVLRPYTLEDCMALSGMVSAEWLRQHPEAARTAGYILIDGKLPLSR